MTADEALEFIAAHRPKQVPARVAWGFYPADASNRDKMRAALLARDHEWLEIVDSLVSHILQNDKI